MMDLIGSWGFFKINNKCYKVYKFDYIFSKLFFRKRQLSRAMAKSMHTKEHFSNEKVLNTFHFSFEKIDDVIIELSKKYKK